MAFKSVSDLSSDITISLGGTNRKTGKKNPTSIEGYYLGKRIVADTKKKTGESFLYFFQTPKGNIGVWGKTDLDRKLSSVAVGTMVRASFDKMVPTPNGEMYKFLVEIDEDNTIEVTGSAQAAPPAYSDADEDQANDGYGGTAVGVDEEEEDEDAMQAMALAKAEKVAKVQALLGKNKTTKN